MKPRMEACDDIKLFKIRQQLDYLESVHGDGTSMLSILVPGTMAQVCQMRQKLSSELGFASNIKDRVNRQSV